MDHTLLQHCRKTMWGFLKRSCIFVWGKDVLKRQIIILEVMLTSKDKEADNLRGRVSEADIIFHKINWGKSTLDDVLSISPSIGHRFGYEKMYSTFPNRVKGKCYKIPKR